MPGRLGDLDLPIPFKPAKCSKESLEKAQGHCHQRQTSQWSMGSG
jgi:hypothetical protein